MSLLFQFEANWKRRIMCLPWRTYRLRTLTLMTNPKGSQWEPYKIKHLVHETHEAKHYNNNFIFFFSSFTKITDSCHYEDLT